VTLKDRYMREVSNWLQWEMRILLQICKLTLFTLYAQLMRDGLAIAKFLVRISDVTFSILSQ